MFKKDYTLVISNENTDENFRRLMTVLGNHGVVKSVKETKEAGWIVIRLKASRHRWQMLMGKLKKGAGLTMYKIGEYWFI